MPAQWTGDVIRQMHLNHITAKKLASEIGWNPKYLSFILNGHANPKDAKQKVNVALNRLIQERATSDGGDIY